MKEGFFSGPGFGKEEDDSFRFNVGLPCSSGVVVLEVVLSFTTCRTSISFLEVEVSGTVVAATAVVVVVVLLCGSTVVAVVAVIVLLPPKSNNLFNMVPCDKFVTRFVAVVRVAAVVIALPATLKFRTTEGR